MPMQDHEHRCDYRETLREELASRCRINPRYSLRAFARDVGLAPSRLSEIFSGKQGLSREAALRVAARLGYTPEEAAVFGDQVESLHARGRMARESARERVERHLSEREMLRLRNETFHLISDWYYLAILELLTTEGFESDPVWLAKALGIGVTEVSLALDRLERFGFIDRKGPRWVVVEQKSSAPGGVPSESIRKFHHQMISKAADAVWLQPIDQRELSSVVIAIDSRRLPLARKLIGEFWREFCTKMEVGVDASAEESGARDSARSGARSGASRSGTEDPSVRKDRVYCLAIQFFALAGGAGGDGHEVDREPTSS